MSGKEYAGAMVDHWKVVDRCGRETICESREEADALVIGSGSLCLYTVLPVWKTYMNIATGSIDTYDGWWYDNENGEKVNAVDLGEVVEVKKNENGDWVEV